MKVSGFMYHAGVHACMFLRHSAATPEMKPSKKGAFFCLKTKRDLFLLCFKTKRNLLANLFAAKASHKTKRDLFFLCLKTTRDLFFLCLKTFFLLYCFKTKRDSRSPGNRFVSRKNGKKRQQKQGLLEQTRYIVKTIRKDYYKNMIVCCLFCFVKKSARKL